MTYRELTACRFCGGSLREVLDLGKTPIANALCLTQEEALASPVFPLELMACAARDCGLYQLSVAVAPLLLFPPGYTYSTPDNPELRAHYAEALGWLRTVAPANARNVCVEIGSNNGLFLRELQRYYQGVSVGVEPSSVEAVPEAATLRGFFSDDFVRGALAEYFREKDFAASGADLVVARHCLAHIDDVHDVLRGVERLLGSRGVFYIENAYALDTLMGGQFDQIYHEHLSYFTLAALERLLEQHGMKVLNVRLSRVHGGSIMVVAAREYHPAVPSGLVGLLRLAERTDPRGLGRRFERDARENILTGSLALQVGHLHARAFVLDAWGAAAKAVTRFAAAGLTHHHIRQCYDDSPLKQGKFLPGSGIPIVACPKELDCDAILLTAWNYERSFRARYASYKGTVIVP